MLEFEKSFFDEEKRDGFYIEPMMKNAWAAQLSVLEKIDKICKENKIRYFADWGTLLGAVRHKGFIPWDDDMDIAMLRPDYMKFLNIMQNKEHQLECLSVFNDPEFGGHPAKVLNNTEFTVSRRKIKENYGFPFMAGVDVFPIDYVPRDEELKDEQISVLKFILKARHLKIEMQEYSPISAEYMSGVKQLTECLDIIKRMCNISFSQENPTDQELMILYEEVAGLYGPEDADYVTAMHRLVKGQQYLIPKEYYEEVKEVQFENILIPIPVEYDMILQLKYGQNYMIPKNIEGGHDYPFYNTLIKKLAQVKGESFDVTREYVINIASKYYHEFLYKTSQPSIYCDEEDCKDVKKGNVVACEQRKSEWAALEETLLEVVRICKKYNIQVYASGDTLKRAVLTHGYDVETKNLSLAMKREDYVSFMNVFQTELSPWFDYSCVYTDRGHNDLRCYIYPDNYLCKREEYAKRFHGCTNDVKVDISVLDAVDPNKDVDEVRKKLVQGLIKTAESISLVPPYSKEEIAVVKEWENVTQMQINFDEDLISQLFIMADKVAGAYRGECERLRNTVDLQQGKDNTVKKIWYDDSVEIVFGDITIPVPVGYREMFKDNDNV